MLPEEVVGRVNGPSITVRTCSLDCCDNEATWCGLCSHHCNGDEEHNVVSTHWDDPVMCECGHATIWCVADIHGHLTPIEIVGQAEEHIVDLIEMNPAHIFFCGPKDLFEGTFGVDADSLIRINKIAVGGYAPNRTPHFPHVRGCQ